MKLKAHRTLIRLKRKYVVGRSPKGIRRHKSDDQPGKVRRVHPHQSSPTRTVPNKGRRGRVPTGVPGSPQGRKVVQRQGRRDA